MEHIDSCLVGPLQGWTDGADLKVTFCRFSCAAAHYTAKRIFVLWSWKLTNLRGELPDLCCISCIKQELMKHQANVEFCCFFKYKMFECIIHIQRVNHVKRINMYEQSHYIKHTADSNTATLLFFHTTDYDRINLLCQYCPSQVDKIGRALALWDMRLYSSHLIRVRTWLT